MGFYYGMQAAFFDVADREPDLPLVRFISLAENGTDKQDVLRAFDPHTYFCVAGDVCPHPLTASPTFWDLLH